MVFSHAFFCLSVFFYERSLCIEKVSRGPLVGGNHHYMDAGFSWRMEIGRWGGEGQDAAWLEVRPLAECPVNLQEWQDGRQAVEQEADDVETRDDA